MSRAIIKFLNNQPITVALEFPEGIHIRGTWGPQVKFSLTDNRLMYCGLDLADAIKTLGVQPGEEFTITKRYEQGRPVWWDLEKRKAPRQSVEKPGPSQTIPEPPKAESSPIPASATGNLADGPVRKIPQVSPVSIPEQPPQYSGMKLTKTPPLKPSYEEAFRECLRIVREGLHDAGEAWSDHSVQAMTTTLFIQAAREGTMRFTVAKGDKVA